MPVVLVHGWLSDVTMWGPKFTPTEGFELIALDCRGHGKSDKPHDPSKYGAEMANDVVRLLDHLKLKKAHVVGYSMGAFIAGKVAATHPDRVLSIVYGGQAPLVTDVYPSGSKEIDVFAEAVEAGKGLGPYIHYVMPAPKPSMDQADAIAKMLYGKKDVKALALAGKSFKGLEVTADDLKKCKAPMLFIHGSEEAANVKNGIAAVQRALGQGEVKVIEGGNHMTTLAKPSFGSALIAFLRSVKP